MCMKSTLVDNTNLFNYDGGRIVHKCIVPSSRTALGSKKSYDIDVREFLITERNEVMKKELSEKIRRFIEEQYPQGILVDNQNVPAFEYFTSCEVGSYDFRARSICAYMTKHLKYVYNKNRKANKRKKELNEKDPWLFPDEMLTVMEGDCEDLSLLLASLLISSGISSYNVRVCLGKVLSHSSKDGKPKEYHHVWVMYKRENASWMLIDPMLYSTPKVEPKKVSTQDVLKVEYKPYYTFNDEHLWAMQAGASDNEFKTMLEFFYSEWNEFEPGFAGEIHRDRILAIALDYNDSSQLSKLFSALMDRFRRIAVVSPLIDDVDNFSLRDVLYHPFDHFDSGFIKESWELLNKRIQAAQTAQQLNNENEFNSKLQYIFHGISDFYAHSSYIHFWAKNNPITDKTIPPIYMPNDTNEGFKYTGADYTSPGSDFRIGEGFLEPHQNSPSDPTIDSLNDTIISGRYGLEQEQHKLGPTERLMPFISPSSTKNVISLSKSYPKMYLMPHHDDIAVDGDEEFNKLYNNEQYFIQLAVRINAAIRHIQTILIENFGYNIQDFKYPYVEMVANGKLSTLVLSKI